MTFLSVEQHDKVIIENPSVTNPETIIGVAKIIVVVDVVF